MKLELQINSRAINDSTRALEGTGVMITPAVDENFWLYRVPVSDKQAIVGFPKFGVIGVGFQHEEDWNTNLPTGTDAVEIFEHIKHNKGDAKIPRERCIEAIRMIQRAVLEVKRKEVIEAVKAAPDDGKRLDILGRFLRHTGN
jgi:hypothetical protein